MQLVPVPVDDIRLHEVKKSARYQETLSEGKAFDVTHVQSEGVGRRGNGAQAHQLTDDVPHADTLKNPPRTQQEKYKKEINICVSLAEFVIFPKHVELFPQT